MIKKRELKNFIIPPLAAAAILLTVFPSAASEDPLSEFPPEPVKHAPIEGVAAPAGLTMEQLDAIISDTVRKADDARIVDAINKMKPGEKLSYLRRKAPDLFKKIVYRLPAQDAAPIIEELAKDNARVPPRFGEPEKPAVPSGDRPGSGDQTPPVPPAAPEPLAPTFDMPVYAIPENPDFGKSKQTPVIGKPAKPKFGKPEIFGPDEEDDALEPPAPPPPLDDGPAVKSRPAGFEVPRPARPNIENPLGENAPRPVFEKDGRKIDISPARPESNDEAVKKPKRGAEKFVEVPAYDRETMIPIEKPFFGEDFKRDKDRLSIKKVRPDFPLPDFKSTTAEISLPDSTETAVKKDPGVLTLAAPDGMDKKGKDSAAADAAPKRPAVSKKKPEFPAFDAPKAPEPLTPPEGFVPAAGPPPEGLEKPDFVKEAEKKAK